MKRLLEKTYTVQEAETGSEALQMAKTEEPDLILLDIALPDGSITSAFLEQFGRPARDTGLEAERNNRTTANQRLHLLNSSHIRQKIEQSPKLKALMKAGGEPRELVTELYLTILSRFPTPEEVKNAEEYGHFNAVPQTGKGGKPAGSNFVDHAAHLAAVVLMGNIAIRTQEKLYWDADKLQFKNSDLANQLMNPPYRAGWTL